MRVFRRQNRHITRKKPQRFGIEVVKVTRDGQLHVFLEGEYRPRAILGDFTVEGARRIDAYANPDGLLIEERLMS